MSLKSAKAIVTGGAGGLGAVICRALAAEGVDLAVGYRTHSARAETLCEDLSSRGVSAFPLQIDISDAAQIEAAVQSAVDRLGGLGLLVNNAGIAAGGHSLPVGDLAAFTPEIWDELMRVNLRGPFLVTRAAAPHLSASGNGRVVMIGSTIGHGAWGAAAAYAPSKGAVVSLTRFLAASLAPDCLVNCVSPGLMIGTDMSGSAPQAYIDAWTGRALTHRTTAAEDVAAQVLTFCRTTSATGQSVVVDGGIHFD